MAQTPTTRRFHRRSGGTLVELMVATAIMSIGLLGFFGAFRYISRSLFVSRGQSLATNLGQERVETLKNLNYYSLLITTAAANIPGITPNIPYDTGNYPPETISIGGINFTRYTYVTMADVTNGDIVTLSYTYPDTGMKQITVTVVWSDQGTSKKWQLTNLLENPNINPLDAAIRGSVKVSGTLANLAGAVVKTDQNPDWTATTDINGNYSFRVYHGTYTVRASSSGYYDAISSVLSASRGGSATANLTLEAIATGTVAGIAWYNSDLVISQVVANTNTVCGDGLSHEVEYVELFNPTTYPIDIGQTGVYPKTVALRYLDEFAAGNKADSAVGFNFHHVTTYVPAGHYYLYANAPSFNILGTWVTADAYYPDTFAYDQNYILNENAGAVQIYRPATGTNLDIVGWQDRSGAGSVPLYETSAIPNGPNPGADPTQDDGLGKPPGKQFVRVSSPAASGMDSGVYGRAYDSNENTKDFLYDSASGLIEFNYRPHNISHGAFPVIAGKVPSGAYVSASDPNSGSTQAYTSYVASGSLQLPYARFQLVGVTTNSASNLWDIAFGYGNYSQVVTGVAVAQNAVTRIPNDDTVPEQVVTPATYLYHVPLNSATAMGFVKGIVTDPNNTPIPNIVVKSGGYQKTTTANGAYFMAVSSGDITLVANQDNQNPSYIQSQVPLTIAEGSMVTQDFTLSMGGRLTGYCTTGTTPIANIVVSVLNGGSEVGTGTTDATGVFTVKNISTGTYTVAPVLESGQNSSPASFTPILNTVGTLFVGTFTVSGSFGNISGTVSDVSGPLTSGALLIASTAAISASPPSIAGATSPSLTPYYMVSSKADGSYVLPVRGGMTYNLSAYVPVINDNGAVSITTKTYSGLAVSASATTTKNVTIP